MDSFRKAFQSADGRTRAAVRRPVVPDGVSWSAEVRRGQGIKRHDLPISRSPWRGQRRWWIPLSAVPTGHGTSWRTPGRTGQDRSASAPRAGRRASTERNRPQPPAAPEGRDGTHARRASEDPQKMIHVTPQPSAPYALPGTHRPPRSRSPSAARMSISGSRRPRRSRAAGIPRAGR